MNNLDKLINLDTAEKLDEEFRLVNFYVVRREFALAELGKRRMEINQRLAFSTRDPLLPSSLFKEGSGKFDNLPEINTVIAALQIERDSKKDYLQQLQQKRALYFKQNEIMGSCPSGVPGVPLSIIVLSIVSGLLLIGLFLKILFFKRKLKLKGHSLYSCKSTNKHQSYLPQIPKIEFEEASVATSSRAFSTQPKSIASHGSNGFI